jgi:N-methylhydantoinase B
MRGIKLRQGQGVRLETPGGGGYGPVSERAARDIARDVARGLVSADVADQTYGTDWREVAS